MGTWRVALSELSTITNITDGLFKTDECDRLGNSDDFSNGDFESMYEEEDELARVKQADNYELYSLPTVLQKRQETLLLSAAASTIDQPR